jgi:acyl-coenzyme A thioesterase PaaI-like protein
MAVRFVMDPREKLARMRAMTTELDLEPVRLHPALTAQGLPRIPLPRLAHHRCFGCGNANPIGLHMTFGMEGEAAVCDLALDPLHMGWEGIAHGGIVTLVLDEIMSWAIIAHHRTFFVTRRVQVEFVRPAPAGTPLVARGVILPEPLDGGWNAGGVLTTPQGRVLARAAGEFVALPPDRVRIIEAGLRADMEQLFVEIARVMEAAPPAAP